MRISLSPINNQELLTMVVKPDNLQKDASLNGMRLFVVRKLKITRDLNENALIII